jgi:hypothetical protein
MKSPDEFVKELCRVLNLRYEAQDWGIVNADATRAEEFIRYYEGTRLEKTQAYEVFELILASLNAALEEELEVGHIIQEFVAKHRNDFPAQVDYWSSLTGAEFPIGESLRQLLTEGLNRPQNGWL